MLGNEKLLFDELYEKTKDCGRVQFVKLLMTKEKENQELKLELSGYRQAILEDKDMLGLKEESEELKKQLEELKIQYFKDTGILSDKILELENQQKEFIEYITSYIELLNNKPDLIEESEIDLLKEILSKFKK